MSEYQYVVFRVIGGEKGKKLAHDRTKKIAKAHPTLIMLKSSLRKRGMLD